MQCANGERAELCHTRRTRKTNGSDGVSIPMVKNRISDIPKSQSEKLRLLGRYIDLPAMAADKADDICYVVDF